MSVNLSGRDVYDICKEAERKWASKYIRKQVPDLTPQLEVYIEATESRLFQMRDANIRMDYDQVSPYAGSKSSEQGQALAFGGK